MVYIRDGVLKMTKGSMVVLKGIRRINLYYLKDNIITSQVKTSISLNDVCTQAWQMRLKHREEKSLQAPSKEGIIGKCIYLQLGIETGHSGQEEGEI